MVRLYWSRKSDCKVWKLHSVGPKLQSCNGLCVGVLGFVNSGGLVGWDVLASTVSIVSCLLHQYIYGVYIKPCKVVLCI